MPLCALFEQSAINACIPWLLQLVVVRFVLSSSPPARGNMRTVSQNLSSHSTSYSFILRSFSFSVSEPRCLLLSPETPLRTDFNQLFGAVFVCSVNFALQKHVKPGQRCDFAVQLCFLSGCEPRQELWTGLPLSRRRTRFVFPCKRILQLCSYLIYNI